VRDDALGLTAQAGDILADTRTGKNGRHALVGMLPQSVFLRVGGKAARLRGFAKPDGPLRDAMACNRAKPLRAGRLVRPVDRFGARSKAAARIVLDMDSTCCGLP
jgi:hypothetical protein